VRAAIVAEGAPGRCLRPEQVAAVFNWGQPRNCPHFNLSLMPARTLTKAETYA